jgi:hypothetical protein
MLLRSSLHRYAVAGLLAATQLVTCQQRHPTTPARNPVSELFALSAGPGVPEGYPATLYRGNFVLPSGGTLPVSLGQLLTGSWGASGTTMPGGRSAAPDSLELLWFSYADDQFYEGHFLLPQQRLQELLQTGFWDTRTQKHDTYKQLTVTLLPKGGVVLWLTGGNKVLVGHYQATPTQFDFTLFSPGATRAEQVREVRAQMPPEARQQLAAGTLNDHPWTRYLAKYPWQLAFRQPVQLYDYGVDYFSAERTNYPVKPAAAGPSKAVNQAAFQQNLLAAGPKGIPSALYLFVQGPTGRRQLRVDPLDEAETLAAFQVLHARYPQEPLVLFIDQDERLTKATLALKAGPQSIPLPKSEIRFFEVQ